MTPGWPYVGEAARSLLGVLLGVILALEWAPEGAAFATGGSAALAGAAALRDNPHRTSVVLKVTAAAAAAALSGALASGHAALTVLVVAVWTAGAALAWAVSIDAGLVAAGLSIVVVGCSHQSISPDGAVLVALSALVGGLTQVMLVTAWPRPQWGARRSALAEAYRSVAAGARGLETATLTTFDVVPLFTLRDTYRGRYGLPERIAMTLTALQSDSRDQKVHAMVMAAADTLDAIGSGGRDSRVAADRSLAALDAAVDTAPDSVTTRRLRAQLHEAASTRFTRPTLATAAVRDILWPQLSWDSPIMRHVARVAGAAALGTGIAVTTGMAQGYWIALTVLLVLRPETAHTYTRCVLRIAAAAAGVGLATSATVLWQPTGVTAAVVAVVFLGLAYAVPVIGYLPVTAALAAAMVFLADVTGAADDGTLGHRLVAVSFGGALAVAVHVILPDRSLVRLHQRAGELLKSEIDYAATVLSQFVHPVDNPEGVVATAWDRTVRARSAFEAASGTARADAPPVRRWLTTYRAGLNAVTASCAVLERYVPAPGLEALDRRFVVAVDDFIDALRGDVPRAGRPWTLDATHLADTEQQLRESAGHLDRAQVAQRVLTVEAETITRHLLSIADAET